MRSHDMSLNCEERQCDHGLRVKLEGHRDDRSAEQARRSSDRQHLEHPLPNEL